MKKIALIQLFFAMFAISIHHSMASAPASTESKADLVVFSFNRPLQLFAFLESVKTHVKNVGTVFVLYRATNGSFQEGYSKVQQHFCDAVFVQQRNKKAHKYFKPLLCDIIANKSTQQHIAFAVDDIIVCDAVDLNYCIEHLEKWNVTGFYLRLGCNISEDYFAAEKARKTPLPNFKVVAPDVLQWEFSKGHPAYWNYPHTVDMTVFRKSYALAAVQSLNYRAPNTFEAQWSKVKPNTPYGLCYTHSKIINIPLNVVQSEYKNKHMGSLSADDLLKLFQANLKINIAALAKCENKSPHCDLMPSFIPIQ